MKNIVITSILSVLMLTACKKGDEVSQASLEQQKLEFQAKQLEIEKQKLAIEKEKMAFEMQKRTDSLKEVEAENVKKEQERAVANSQPKVVTKTRTVYRDRNVSSGSSSNGTYANNSGTTQTTQKKGMSKAAKGTIIGTVGGAAAGAIINKKNRGLGAVIGGVIGGATGYTIGRAGDRKDGRVQPQ